MNYAHATPNKYDSFTLLNLTEESVKLAAQNMAKLRKEGRLIEFRDLFIGTISQVHSYLLNRIHRNPSSHCPKTGFINIK